jgi:hypothetical protein
MPAGRTTIAVLLTGLATALVTTACAGNNQQGTAASQPPSSPSATGTGVDQNKVDFADDLCGAVSKFLTPAAAFKPDTSSQAAAVNSMKAQLGTLSTGLQDASTDLSDASTEGVPDGQAVVTDLRKAFDQMKTTVDQSKAKLDAIDPNNTQQVTVAVQQASKDLNSLGSSMQNPLDQPNLKSADMEAAAEKAPECQKIKGTMATKTPPTS